VQTCVVAGPVQFGNCAMRAEHVHADECESPS
jgi:hypothetical protein